MTITREMLRDIRIESEQALAAIGKKHGVIITIGRATFNASSAKFTMELTKSTEAAQVAVASGVRPKHAMAAEDYKRLCTQYGMKPEWFGQSFTWGRGKGLCIVGLLPNKHKNNVLVEGTGGGKYIMSPADVIACFPK